MNGRSASQPNGTSRVRNGSQSSSSSLSSVDEKILDAGLSPNPPRFINNYPIFAPPASGSYKSPYASAPVPAPAPSPTFVSPYTSANNFSAAGGSPAETLARSNQPPPISAPIKNGPKTFVFKVTTTSSAVANSSSSANNTAAANNKKSSTTKSSMAPAALLDSSHSSSASTTQSSLKAKKAAAKVTVLPQVEVINDQSSRMKRRAREYTDSVTKDKTEKSFERHQVRDADYDSATDGGHFVTVAASKRPQKVRLVTKTRETRHRVNDDSDSLSSPGFSNFVPDFAKESAPSSRAATPNPSGRPTRKAKGSSHLRVKSSPMKKKPGTSAGIPRPGGEQSPVGNGAAQDDNNDYCSACGGNGDLVCCDGYNCKRSFHFRCVDPPVLEGGLPDESWFCNQCSNHHENGISESESKYNGPFGPLIWTLEVKNPSAFHLPKHIRELFDQVKTGENGEYENDAPVKPKSRTGYEEAPDYFRKKDAKGKLILCHSCHKTAEPPARMIIPCAFCSLYWHMDCLDVPMAKEPGPGRQWRCPAHIDDLLVALPESLAPAHRYRKIKNAPVIKPTVSRGLRNNGYIEIENDATDNEQEQGFYEQRQYGHVYKLPEQGIKLDFLAKARQYGGGLPSYDRVVKPPSTPVAFSARDLEMQQAALNLTALHSQNMDQDQTSLLINTLLSQAPPAVIPMLAQVQSDELISGQKMSKPSRQLLQNLRDMLDQRLGETQSGDEDDFERRTLTPPSTEKGSTKASDQDINGDKDCDTEMML